MPSTYRIGMYWKSSSIRSILRRKTTPKCGKYLQCSEYLQTEGAHLRPELANNGSKLLPQRRTLLRRSQSQQAERGCRYSKAEEPLSRIYGSPPLFGRAFVLCVLGAKEIHARRTRKSTISYFFMVISIHQHCFFIMILMTIIMTIMERMKRVKKNESNKNNESNENIE